jgi:TolB-like protein/Tfp pilus assembly protein PilF
MTDDSANQTPSGHDVFVSYASQDAAVANSLVANLEHNLKCWIAPRDVKAGTVYADAIVRAINDAKALVLILSMSSMASSHVGREVERAASKRKQIIAFRLDAAALSPELEYFLSNSQWIDVPTLGMPAALTKLKEAVGQGSTTPPQAVANPRSGGVRKRAIIVAAAVFGVAAAGAIGLHFWPRGRGGAQVPAVIAISDKSIAVLPFVDMSEKRDQEYFADGMTEEIIDLLARVPDLQVPARTSSFYFKGRQSTIADITRALGVQNVLEGSVRKSGSILRVTVQLIRADTGYHIWSQTYDRKLDDIFKVQDEIAGTVVKELKASLLHNESLRAPPTANGDAYTLYLQARALFRRGETEDYQSAYDHLQKALVLDPHFASAWSEIAWIRVRQYRLELVPLPQASREAHAAIAKALQLAPNLAEAHLTLGRILYLMDWDWLQAESEINRAIDLDPGIADSYQWAGMVQATLRRTKEAMRFYQQVRARDPLAPHAYELSAELYIREGNWADAEKDWARAHALLPAMYDESYIAQVELVRGRPELALASLGDSKGHYAAAWRSRALLALGRKADADAELARLEVIGADSVPYRIAVLHALRGEIPDAFKWLDRAYGLHDLDLLFVKGDPDLKIIESDPRYKAFLKKMNLPE